MHSVVRWVLAGVAVSMATTARAQDVTAFRTAATQHQPESVLDLPARLAIERAPLDTALERLRESSGVVVAFSRSLLPLNGRKVTCICDASTIGEALDQLLAGTPSITYTEVHGNIVVHRATTMPIGSRLAFSTKPVASTVPSLLRGSRSPRDLQGTVTGRVLDGQTQQPLSGARVSIDGTEIVGLTRSDGQFTLADVPAGTHTLTAEMVGYASTTREVTVSEGETVALEIALPVEAIQMNEIIAIGYGTARRRDVAGSIASVSADDLMTGRATPTTSVAGTLLGRASGVQVVTNSATPGAAAVVQVRGTNSITASSAPLYVVDGIPLGTDAGNMIDPNNIESIQILKDASATAIYGSRGANGVVLITTTRGAAGTSQITITSGYGFQEPSKFIPVLTGPEYLTLANEAAVNAGLDPRYTDAQVAAAETFDYPRMMLQDLEPQPQHTHVLTLSGADERTRFLISGNYMKQAGLMINSGFERVGGRVNLDRDMSDRLRIGISLSGTYSVQNVNTTETTTNAPGQSTGILAAMQFDPSVAPKDSLGNWVKSVTLGAQQPNPFANAVEIRSPNHTTAFLTSAFGEYDLTERLRLRSTIGGNFGFNRSPYYAPSTIAPGNNEGVARQASAERRELTSENTLTYERELGPGNIETLVGFSIQTSRFQTYQAEAQGFPVDNFEYNNLGAGTTLLPSSSDVAEWTLLSQLARVNYNLLGRYLFTVTGRRDGSSRFAVNNKWAVFPSVAFAWRIIDESFMLNQALISDLRFRASYGRTGNQAITEYESLARLTTAFVGLGTDTDEAALAPTTSAANPDLKWETQDQYNIGLDLGFLENRISLTLDAYHSDTRNLLLAVDQPFRTGFSSQLQNVGAVRNRGLELSLSTINVDRDDFRWETTLNVAANRNEVTQLYGGLDDLGAGSGTRVGEPLNTIVGHKVLGLWQDGETCDLINTVECTPGEYKILDANGDGVINDDDRVILGNPQPDFYGGFTSQMTYGPLSLDAFFNFSVGNEIHNSSLRFTGLSAGFLNERRDVALNRWTPTNTNTTVPRANFARNNQRVYSTHVEDGSFLRLQTLTLSYRVPARLIPGVSDARLMLTGENLWIATKYTGYDPEQGAVDPGGYPRARTWNIGIDVTF